MVSINTKIGTIDHHGIEIMTTIECDDGVSTLFIRSNSALGRDWRYEFTDFDGDVYLWITDQCPESGKNGRYNPDNIFQFSATAHEIKQNGKRMNGQLPVTSQAKAPMPEITKTTGPFRVTAEFKAS